MRDHARAEFPDNRLLNRMEGQVAIGKLVQRFPQLRRAGEQVRGGRARFRGFLRLPVAVR